LAPTLALGRESCDASERLLATDGVRCEAAAASTSSEPPHPSPCRELRAGGDPALQHAAPGAGLVVRTGARRRAASEPRRRRGLPGSGRREATRI